MKYVKLDIQRAFDYLKICADDLQTTGFKWEEKNIHTEKLWMARGKIMEAIELLASANNEYKRRDVL